MNVRKFVRTHLKVDSVMGPEWLCLCPYHKDTNASFCVNVRKGVFICYSCGKKGSMADLEKHLNTGDQIDLATTTAKELKVKIESLQNPVSVVSEIIQDSEVAFFRMNDQQIHPWESIRNIKEGTGNLFSLGYDPMRDALVMPVHEWGTGKVVSLIRRNLDISDGSPKYKYMKGFKISHNLYGAWQCVTSIPGGRPAKIAIVEGPIDALSMWEVNCPAVAILGASPSVKQVNLLKALAPTEYVVMTDKDRAGREAALKIESALRKSGIVVSHPKDKYWSKEYKDADSLPPLDRANAFADSERKKTWM